METGCCSFNLDDRAFERGTAGLMPPALIMVLLQDAAEDDNIVVNPRLAQQRQPDTPAPRQEPPTTDESINMAFIMANASDLKAFQELEGYTFSKLDSGAETDVPEADFDESDASDDNDINGVDVVSDVAGE
ncbi:hypothetical protein KC19_10G114800 [Ceratodon purpureus]|uniref:Uncharacterized protein n=1 Tax=Ceratodon purpureus TaxID=3225 RepID=A0A8T0GKN7_CERPU|nr:hypothetical protein KC19_10G114800 [Ceratodon purpureus]